MDKYALITSCRCDFWIKVYMYAFMYVDPETMPEDD